MCFSQKISSRFYKSDVQEVMIGELEDPTRKHGKQLRTQGQRASAIGFIGFSSDGKVNNFIRMVLGESENDRKVVDVFSTCDPTNHGTSRFTSDLARNRCVNMMQRKTPSLEKMQVKITFRHVVDMEESQTQMIPQDFHPQRTKNNHISGRNTPTPRIRWYSGISPATKCVSGRQKNGANHCEQSDTTGQTLKREKFDYAWSHRETTGGSRGRREEANRDVLACVFAPKTHDRRTKVKPMTATTHNHNCGEDRRD